MIRKSVAAASETRDDLITKTFDDAEHVVDRRVIVRIQNDELVFFEPRYDSIGTFGSLPRSRVDECRHLLFETSFYL